MNFGYSSLDNVLTRVPNINRNKRKKPIGLYLVKIYQGSRKLNMFYRCYALTW